MQLSCHCIGYILYHNTYGICLSTEKLSPRTLTHLRPSLFIFGLSNPILISISLSNSISKASFKWSILLFRKIFYIFCASNIIFYCCQMRTLTYLKKKFTKFVFFWDYYLWKFVIKTCAGNLLFVLLFR